MQVNDLKFKKYKQLRKSKEEKGERLWEMSMFFCYKQGIVGGGRENGDLTLCQH